MFFISTAFAQDGGAAAAGGLMGGVMQFAPLIAIVAIFYFLLIRPQQKRQKEHQAKINSARRGDQVLTGGGIYGKVTKVLDDGKLQVEVAEGVRLRVAASTLMDVISKTEPVKAGKADKAEKSDEPKDEKSA